MYWLMLRHSTFPNWNSDFVNVDTIGIFNPRLNISYSINRHDISEDILQTVETEVIGYDLEDIKHNPLFVRGW